MKPDRQLFSTVRAVRSAVLRACVYLCALLTAGLLLGILGYVLFKGVPHLTWELLSGKPSVINVWAWWCGPCREELPIIQQLAQDNPQWNVVGVHLDAKAQAGADLLKTLNVTDLASYQDSNHTFDAATGIPKVVPVTIVYRADGTRAATFAQTFDSEAELQQKIQEAL